LRVGVIGGPRQETNSLLVGAWRAAGIDALLLSPEEAPWRLDAGDVALVRLDVRQTLDGIEPGLRLLQPLTRRGIRVLNRPDALIGAHDKLETARRLRVAGIATAATRCAAATLFSTPPPRSTFDRVVRRRCLRLLRPRASADHSCAS
jgi:hypothetical protein